MHSCHGRRCTVCCSFLRVEWHLNSLPEEERLGGVALRLGLRHLITRGCGTQQPSHEIVVEDEEVRRASVRLDATPPSCPPTLSVQCLRHGMSDCGRGVRRSATLCSLVCSACVPHAHFLVSACGVHMRAAGGMRLGLGLLRSSISHLTGRLLSASSPSPYRLLTASLPCVSSQYRPINFGKAVPGLLEEHFRHVERKDKLTKGPRVAESGELMHGQLPLGISWNVSTHKRPVEGRTLFTVHDRNGTTTAFQFLG
jgi:hypothetical protein